MSKTCLLYFIVCLITGFAASAQNTVIERNSPAYLVDVPSIQYIRKAQLCVCWNAAYYSLKWLDESAKKKKDVSLSDNFMNKCPYSDQVAILQINEAIDDSISRTKMLIANIYFESSADLFNEKQFKATSLLKSYFSDSAQCKYLWKFLLSKNDTQQREFKEAINDELERLDSKLEKNMVLDEAKGTNNEITPIDSGYKVWIPVLIVLLGLVLISIQIFRVSSKISSRNEETILEIEASRSKRSYEAENSVLRSDEMKQFAATVKNDYLKIFKAIDELNKTRTNDKVEKPNFQKSVQLSTEMPQKNASESSEVLFFSVPNEDDRSFNVSSAREYFEAGNSIYRFTIIRPGIAEVRIEDSLAAFKKALQYHSKNIEWICDTDNLYFSGAQKVLTISPGIAELRGQRWYVSTPPKIKYE